MSVIKGRGWVQKHDSCCWGGRIVTLVLLKGRRVERVGDRGGGRGRKTRDMNKIVHDLLPEEAWNVAMLIVRKY